MLTDTWVCFKKNIMQGYYLTKDKLLPGRATYRALPLRLLIQKRKVLNKDKVTTFNKDLAFNPSREETGASNRALHDGRHRA
jgi:hypothetical protein